RDQPVQDAGNLLGRSKADAAELHQFWMAPVAEVDRGEAAAQRHHQRVGTRVILAGRDIDVMPTRRLTSAAPGVGRWPTRNAPRRVLADYRRRKGIRGAWSGQGSVLGRAPIRRRVHTRSG